MKLRTRLATLLVASTLIHTACSSDGPSDTGPGGDGGDTADGGTGDGGATSGPGTKVGAVPATDIHVTSDGAEVLWLDTNGELKAVPAGGGNVKSLTVMPDILGGRGTPTLWYWEAGADGSPSGELHSYRSGATSTTRVAQGAARGVFYISDGGETVVTSENHRAVGANQVVDLAVVKRDGTAKMTVMTGVNIGAYDMTEAEFTGDCSPEGAYVGDSHAFVLACVGAATQRSVIWVDVAGRTAREIPGTTGAAKAVFVGADGSFALFADAQSRLFGISAAGGAPIAINDADPVFDVFPLSGKRFAYYTDTMMSHMKVASFPRMTPSQLMPDDVYAILASSPDGSKLLFAFDSDANDFATDLLLVSTSTAPAAAEVTINMATDAIPGDDSFSTDGQYVFYFRNLNDDAIGIAVASKADGTGQPVTLAPQTYYILNYADANGVLLMTNASVHRDGYITADIAVRKRDGSAALQTLVGGINADEFALFPSRDKIAFIIEEGGNAGVWVRSVP